MVGKFVRAENSDYPKIHHSFFAKDVGSDELVEYSIGDLTEEYADEAADLVINHLVPYEVFNKALKVDEDTEAKATLKEFYKHVVGRKVSLGCFRKGSNELVGLNMLIVKSKTDEKYQIDNPKIQSMLDTFAFVDQHFNAAEFYNVNDFLYGVGLVVDNNFRGRGISTEILKARVSLMKALGLTVTTTIFSGIYSQKAAFSADFEENFAISFNDLQEKFPAMDFSHANTTHCKTMSLKIE